MRASKIIRQFKVTSKYKGYPLIIDAIELSIQNYGDCIKITKDIYPALSEKYGIPQYSVERNIRTIIEACWKNDRELLKKIAGCDLIKCPTNSDFIDSVAYYIIENDL